MLPKNNHRRLEKPLTFEVKPTGIKNSVLQVASRQIVTTILALRVQLPRFQLRRVPTKTGANRSGHPWKVAASKKKKKQKLYYLTMM